MMQSAQPGTRSHLARLLYTLRYTSRNQEPGSFTALTFLVPVS